MVKFKSITEPAFVFGSSPFPGVFRGSSPGEGGVGGKKVSGTGGGVFPEGHDVVGDLLGALSLKTGTRVCHRVRLVKVAEGQLWMGLWLS
ncbi:MAG: hypothetical protein CM1200mP2_55690 [Planctomycetaceae bacterium]|nr:MAG: hypothetical protein CM1200mP2_55690 [Planctomycetaceae bacterium]